MRGQGLNKRVYALLKVLLMCMFQFKRTPRFGIERVNIFAPILGEFNQLPLVIPVCPLLTYKPKKNCVQFLNQ